MGLGLALALGLGLGLGFGCVPIGMVSPSPHVSPRGIRKRSHVALSSLRDKAPGCAREAVASSAPISTGVEVTAECARLFAIATPEAASPSSRLVSGAWQCATRRTSSGSKPLGRKGARSEAGPMSALPPSTKAVTMQMG